MDGADAFAAPAPNPWSQLVRGYFSPATLFLLLNVVIGTIALTSRSHRRRDEECDLYAPPPPPAAPIARTSSAMERLRSLGLIYRFRSGDFPPEYNTHHFAATAADGAFDAHQARQSRPLPPVRKTGNKAVEPATSASSRAVIKMSTADVKKLERAPAQPRRVQRAPAAVREVEEDDAAAVSVDARADDFINRFRQQLQLQRLNSLLNYNGMLNR